MKKIFIFAIVVLGTFACKTPEISIKPESNSNANVNVNSNVNANANSPAKIESETNTNSASTSGNPRDELVKSSKKFVEQKQFRANIKGVGDGGDDEKIMVMEYVAPDRYRLKDGKSMDAIVIGKDFYMNINGKWQKAPGGDTDGKMPTMRDMFTEEGLKSMKDVEYVGEETVGGKTARVYRYKSANIKDMPAFDAKIWIGKDSELPLQIEINEGENKEVEKVVITYDYDSNIKIEVPTVK